MQGQEADPSGEDGDLLSQYTPALSASMAAKIAWNNLSWADSTAKPAKVRLISRQAQIAHRLCRGESGRRGLSPPSYSPSVAVACSVSPPSRGSPLRVVAERLRRSPTTTTAMPSVTATTQAMRSLLIEATYCEQARYRYGIRIPVSGLRIGSRKPFAVDLGLARPRSSILFG